MIKKTYLILFSAILSSCSIYIDQQDNIRETYELYTYENHNTFKQVKKTLIRFSKKSFYFKKKFEVNLPKNIIVFYETSDYLVFEFPSKQIIVIESGNENEEIKRQKWKFHEFVDFEIVSFYLDSYYNRMNYNSEDLDKENKGNRISLLYSDNLSTILLYNIKKENIEYYKTQIMSFRYVE